MKNICAICAKDSTLSKNNFWQIFGKKANFWQFRQFPHQPLQKKTTTELSENVVLIDIYRWLRLGFYNCGSPPNNNFFFFLIFSTFESKIWHWFPHLEFSRRFLICFWSSTLGKCWNFHIYGLLNPSFAGNRTDLKSPNFLGNPAWALRLSKNYSLMVEMLLNCNNKVNFRWRQIKTYYMHSLK